MVFDCSILRDTLVVMRHSIKRDLDAFDCVSWQNQKKTRRMVSLLMVALEQLLILHKRNK